MVELIKIIGASFFVSALLLPSLSQAVCEKKEIEVNGVKRSGVICVDTTNTSANKPLVLAFHGRGSNSVEFAKAILLHEAWKEAVVVYPDGLTGNPAPYDINGERTGWQLNSGELSDRDVLFSDLIVTSVAKKYSIDPKRIFAIGHSNGSRMVAVLMQQRPHVFSAFAFSAAQADDIIFRTPYQKSMFMGMGVSDTVAPFSWQKRSIGYAGEKLGANTYLFDNVGLHSAIGNSGKTLDVFVHSGGHIWPAEQTPLIVNFLSQSR